MLWRHHFCRLWASQSVGRLWLPRHLWQTTKSKKIRYHKKFFFNSNMVEFWTYFFNVFFFIFSMETDVDSKKQQRMNDRLNAFNNKYQRTVKSELKQTDQVRQYPSLFGLDRKCEQHRNPMASHEFYIITLMLCFILVCKFWTQKKSVSLKSGPSWALTILRSRADFHAQIGSRESPKGAFGRRRVMAE